MASTSKITVDGVKYDVRDDFLRNEIDKLQDKVTAGEGIEISEDGTVSLISMKKENITNGRS